MMRNKPRVEFSERFTNFAETVISQFNQSENPKLRMLRQKLNSMAQDFGIDMLKNPGKQALRDFLTERGYKIHIGASAVHVSKIPVTNVPEDQWPALVQNLGRRLVTLFVEKGEPIMRIWPAQFRNIATVWPADHAAFNQMVIDHLAQQGYTLTFQVNAVVMYVTGTERKRGKKSVKDKPTQPKIEVMNGRAFLPIALAGRRVSWRRDYTQALLVNAKHNEAPGGFTPTVAFVALTEPVYDCNGVALTTFVINHGDVLLANDEAHEIIKRGKLRCAVTGQWFEPALLATSLKD